VTRSKTGQAISRARRRPAQLKQLDAFIAEARLNNNLDEWRRGRGVRGYIDGRSVISLAQELGVTRGSVNRWLQWYEADHVQGLRTRSAPGATPRLTESQRTALTEIIESGPIAAGYQSGVWTGPMIGDLIEQRFGVRYHNHHVPRLLHQLGFSVQRPRKRLAQADLERQATWLRETLPAIKKKLASAAAS
jgi:transposase